VSLLCLFTYINDTCDDTDVDAAIGVADDTYVGGGSFHLNRGPYLDMNRLYEHFFEHLVGQIVCVLKLLF